MKNTLIILLSLFISLCAEAQQKISYSLNTYYYEPLQMNIASLEYSLKDSIHARNLPVGASGFIDKVNIPLFEKATKIETATGYRFLLRIKAANMNSVGIYLAIRLVSNDTIKVIYANGSINENYNQSDNSKDSVGTLLSDPFSDEFIIDLTINDKNL
jgi:hypothetical protein